MENNDIELKKVLNELKNNEIQESTLASNSNQEQVENIRKYNTISSRIFTISLIFKWSGYLCSIILCIIFIVANQVLLGLLYGLLSSLSVFIFTTFLDGFAEIIQLLEDIKNNQKEDKR